MTETSVAEKFCRANVKNEFGEKVPCGERLKGECRNRKEHVGKYKTGFCSNGFCEGKSIKSEMTGKPFKHCADWKHCGCTCHEEIDKLYIMMQQPRQSKDLSGYEPPISHYHMPSLEERVAMHHQAKSPAAELVIIESPLPGVIPATISREFTETNTGRTGRGQLEFWVKEYCDEYLVEKYDEPCTPKNVSLAIGKSKGIPTPSQGAVDAVFKRWNALGFALVASKPTRFIGYTPDGVKLGLEAMKLRAKQNSRSAEAEKSRTLRPKRRD